MFLCSNMCTGGEMEPELHVKEVPFEAKFMTEFTKEIKRHKKNTHVQMKRSKYDDHLDYHVQKGSKFTDPDFPPNEHSLNFTIEGRKLGWERVGKVVPNATFVEGDFTPSDIQQGNIGDCYFLSSIASLAEVRERIANIFLNKLEYSEQGIYKILVVQGGAPVQMVIDDYIPVFADTNRPVFCKATGRQVWVMLLQKAWAKIKGSYGAISAGCPHEVLQTFSVGPCYYHQLDQDTSPEYIDQIWDDLVDAAEEVMPVVAGTKTEVTLKGLMPFHAYTILESANVVSHGKTYRIVRMRNPWGNTETTGFASENDDQFWNGVDPKMQKLMRPAVGKNDGDFTITFENFMKNFNSIDILNEIIGFSYEFEKIKMYRGQPLFIRFDITEEHESFVTVERQYGKGDSNQDVMTTNYGYTRMIIAHQRDENTFEYFNSILESDFPDCTTYVTFKPGRYLMYVEIDDPKLQDRFDATFSYYFDTLQNGEGKKISFEYDEKYPQFLEAVFMNHALRMNNEPSRIGPKPEDWVKSNFMYKEGGFGYVMVNLQQGTNIRISVTVNRKKIEENGFKLLTRQSNEETISGGQYQIYVFTCILDGQQAENYTFPPNGFRIAKIA